MLKKLFLFLVALNTILSAGCKENPAETEKITDQTPPPADTVKGWKMVWADEFDYTGLPDSTKWNYDVGGHGWGNNELQFYTEKRLQNSRVENGNLIIEAVKEPFNGMDYSSTRLVSRNKGDWTYGRFEIKAKLPSGKGTWPAIWMLPTEWTYGSGGWPDNGEIDIMEHVGYDPNWIHGSTHCKTYYWRTNTQRSNKIHIPTAQTEFHVYAIEWTSDKIDFYVDSVKYYTSVNEGTGWAEWPFDKDFHLIMNVAVGGDWGGQKGVDPSVFPQKLLVDYVRVYQWNE